MSHKFPKYKILLDENFPLKQLLPRLNSRHNLRHIVTDFKKVGINDFKVYRLAVKEKRIVITFNDKDFRGFATKSYNSGIIGVSATLSIDQIDKKLTSLFNRSKSNDLFGKFNYISGETKINSSNK